MKLSDQYWREVAENEGIQSKDIFAQTTDEKLIEQQQRVKERNAEGDPVQLNIVSQYQMYKVDYH